MLFHGQRLPCSRHAGVLPPCHATWAGSATWVALMDYAEVLGSV